MFLRYPDGVAVLPECWLWHPDVVEELLWLMHAWRAAYEGRGASVQLAGDWHDRQRPGVVRRVRTAVGSCSPGTPPDPTRLEQPTRRRHPGPRRSTPPPSIACVVGRTPATTPAPNQPDDPTAAATG